MNKFKNGIFLFLFVFVLASCASKKDKPLRYLSIMTFNVENLFDTEHDKGKLDYTYLPLSLKKGRLIQEVTKYCATLKNPSWKKDCLELNWDDRLLNEKLRRVGQVISEATSGCPDVVVLQEVENEKVLKRLKTFMTCDYPTVTLSDDRDARGIDVAILSKFDLKGLTTETIPFTKLDGDKLKDTRGILRVHFDIGNYPVQIFGVHLPAPFHPVEQRQDAVKFLNALYYKDEVATVIAGDWNIPDTENIFAKVTDPLRANFLFSEEIVRSSSSARGSTYYAKDGTWSFLDKVALSRNSFDRVECHVINFLPGQRSADASSSPLSFPLNGKLSEGVSDHFPILCKASF